MRIVIIGMRDKAPEMSLQVKEEISKANNFAGGKRHFELVSKDLPLNAEWHNIIVPLSELFAKISEKDGHWVVFASGDPLFFGIGNTLKKQFPNAEIKVIPDFNSLQLLAHKIMLPYGEYQVITLTGRPWHEFDKALIQGVSKMGVLTDRTHTPAAIAERMLKYNYVNYRMYYGERMGGGEERVEEVSLEQAVKMNYKHPNCFFLQKTVEKIPQKGIPETEFETLAGRPKMITKMPIRLTTLSLMKMNTRKVFWDVGACSGSVSIEAKLHNPHLKVNAFEIRPECEGIIKRNTHKFQVPGIKLRIGDFLEIEKESMEAPDAVFLGGYGGKMEEILDEIKKHILPEGVIAFNAVTSESKVKFTHWCEKNQYKLQNSHQIAFDDNNKMNILVAEN